MRNALYPRLAAQNLRQNRRFYLPYLLALVGLAAAFSVMAALSMDQGVQELRGTEFVSYMMSLGLVVAAILSAVLVLYINSFLMKQRKKELGLYNILGMGKGNIARLQCWESFYTALIGIAGGILCGIALHWLSTVVLVRLLRFAVPFRPGVSPAAMAMTAARFGGLLLLAEVRHVSGGKFLRRHTSSSSTTGQWSLPSTSARIEAETTRGISRSDTIK